VLHKAQRLAEGAHGNRRSRGRDDAGFMLSAARSLIFNAMLAERVTRGTWNRLSIGDVANLDGRGSVFAIDALDAELEQRCAALDVHPTAPLVGQGESLARGEVLALEDAITAQFPEALAVVHAEGMKPERRALIRVRGSNMVFGRYAAAAFALSAGSLPPPCFARSSRAATGACSTSATTKLR
jgi:tRNA pseudouridine13 synthase